MDDELELFRLKYRVTLLEHFVLPLFVEALASQPGMTIAKAREHLTAANRENALKAYGEHFRDPAQLALYADEIDEILQSLERLVDKLD